MERAEIHRWKGRCRAALAGVCVAQATFMSPAATAAQNEPEEVVVKAALPEGAIAVESPVPGSVWKILVEPGRVTLSPAHVPPGARRVACRGLWALPGLIDLQVHFREPGGNHLEIEYYNPGGALHGRTHTAGHWQSPLTDERFPERGYLPQAFTHGTLQCDDIERSRRFYTEVLGLEIAAGFNNAQYIKHSAAPWYIVVLRRSPRQYLAPVNRFTLQSESAAEVEQAHRAFSVNGEGIGITELHELQNNKGTASFIFSDADRNWWELTAQA